MYVRWIHHIPAWILREEDRNHWLVEKYATPAHYGLRHALPRSECEDHREGPANSAVSEWWYL
jgi:hypothetical protein